MNSTAAQPSYSQLADIPTIDLPSNVSAALRAGRRATGIAGETLSLRRGPGRLTPQEYFYYQLWDATLEYESKLRFVGKLAQAAMHEAAGAREWFAASADKILFQSIMDGAGLPTPELIAITQRSRHLARTATVTSPDELADRLRDPSLYPLFAKPVNGKYSLGVLSAETIDAGVLALLGNERRKVSDIAETLVSGAGYLIQRRLAPALELAARFGPRLWSVRLLVFSTPEGPVIHRAVVKIATGSNPADNYWRPGNRLGAIDLGSGRITRVVTGTGLDLQIAPTHPDTGAPIVGTVVPNWPLLVERVRTASKVFAGIRTQSWDVALSSAGPVFLELNYGGDLNLHQLAHGAGVLDDIYRQHLRRCGYRGKL